MDKLNKLKKAPTITTTSPQLLRSGRVRIPVTNLARSTSFDDNIDMSFVGGIQAGFTSSFRNITGIEELDLNSSFDESLLEKSLDKTIVVSKGNLSESSEKEETDIEVEESEDNIENKLFFDHLEKYDFDKEDNVNCLIVATTHNKPKLAFMGFFYTIDKQFSNKNISWKCERTGNKSQAKCPGRCLTLGYSLIYFPYCLQFFISVF